jgi:16S rRNA (uracil1498-N3)-methyltransferase
MGGIKIHKALISIPSSAVWKTLEKDYNIKIMRRFFVDPENFSGNTAFLYGSEAHHIATVLRLTAGTRITLFDGSGSLYEAQIKKVSPKKIETTIESITPYIPIAQEQQSNVHLGQAIIKGKKMDFIVQKATELGIACLHPFISTYCAVKKTPESRAERWTKIAQEACKQCNRPVIPHIHPPVDFTTFLESAAKSPYDLKLLFWEEEHQNSLGGILKQYSGIHSVLLLIGPEGGFSPAEAEQALADGFLPVTLGNKILRAETAALTALAVLQYELGNLS